MPSAGGGQDTQVDLELVGGNDLHCFHKKVLSWCCFMLLSGLYIHSSILQTDSAPWGQGLHSTPTRLCPGGHHQAQGSSVAPISGLSVLSLQTSLRPLFGEESVSLRSALSSDHSAVPSFSSDPWEQLLLGH